MQVVKLLVAADGVHVRQKAVSGVEVVAAERHTLPLRERVDDLRALAADRRDIKADRALNAVKVVVQAARGLHKQRRGDALEVQGEAQLLPKQILDQADCLLRIVEAEARAVPLLSLIHI